MPCERSVNISLLMCFVRNILFVLIAPFQVFFLFFFGNDKFEILRGAE